MDDAELKRRLVAVQEKYGHLLTREAALAHISAGHSGSTSGHSFEARVLRIFTPYEFAKAGRKGKVCRVELERLGSGTDERPMLVLWDADVEKLQKGEIAAGDLIAVSGANVREGEFHIGRQGSVRRIGRGSTADAKKAEREAGREKLAVILDVKASGKSLEAIVELDGKREKLKLSGEKALSFLGLKQAHDGISLETLVALKRVYLVGKAIRL